MTTALCRSIKTYRQQLRQNAPLLGMLGLLERLLGTTMAVHTGQRHGLQVQGASSHLVCSRFLSSAASTEHVYSLCQDPETGDSISLAEHYKKYGFVIAMDLLSHDEVTQYCTGLSPSWCWVWYRPLICVGVVSDGGNGGHLSRTARSYSWHCRQWLRGNRRISSREVSLHSLSTQGRPSLHALLVNRVFSQLIITGSLDCHRNQSVASICVFRCIKSVHLSHLSVHESETAACLLTDLRENLWIGQGAQNCLCTSAVYRTKHKSHADNDVHERSREKRTGMSPGRVLHTNKGQVELRLTWSQHTLFMGPKFRSLCASWVALDDATIENGCIWIIPKSHHRGVSIHHLHMQLRS